jgi:hypothetical protein
LLLLPITRILLLSEVLLPHCADKAAVKAVAYLTGCCIAVHTEQTPSICWCWACCCT